MTKPDHMPLTSSHWGTYRARLRNGKLQELLPFEEDADPSPIGVGILDVQDGPTRVDAPMIRRSWLEGGPGTRTDLRGVEPFVEVSWDQASKLVAQELDRVRKTHGNSAIFGGSYGWASAGRFHHAQSQLHRFLNCIGGYTKSKFTYSFAAAEAMVPHILGSFRAYLDSCTSYESICAHTELFVCFGGVPLKNGQISQGGAGSHIQRAGLAQAAASQIKFVNISPIKSDLPDEVDGNWLPIRPNTDTALMLALAHTLHIEGLSDQAFLERYTEGFDRFLPYLMGQTDGCPKSADWAANICELEADTIRDLARRMAAHRTMVSVSWSLTRQDHGEQPFWAAIALAAMLGQIGLPGGGFGFGYSAMNYIGGNFRSLQGASFPQKSNAVSDFIPVARIADLLMKPGDEFDFDGRRYRFPDIRLIYWAGGNPFHHHQDLNHLIQAWQKPETIVVNEWCWNALAKRADIVLPCTTPLERQDIAITPRDPYVVSMSKLSEPPSGARDDFSIFSLIAQEMRSFEEFTEDLSAKEWQKRVYLESRERASAAGITIPSYDEFREMGWFKLESPEDLLVMLSDFRADPHVNPLDTPSGKIEIFSQTVADFEYEDCPGHPIWQEPYEWLGDVDRWPLHLISNQPKDKLHSQLDHGSVSRSHKVSGREPVHINPVDAENRGLRSGDVVRLFNDRGACLGGVVIDDAIRRGVVQMSTGSWYDPEDPSVHGSLRKHGNPNVLTRDKGTSKLGQGPTAHSCLIDIEKYEAPPPVTAHDPPTIIRLAVSVPKQSK